MNKLRRTAPLWAALLLVLGAPAFAQWQLTDGARTHPDYRGPVPKKSDVEFSTRFKRAAALEAAKSFGATRVEWVYADEPAYVAQLKKGIGWFGGSLNANSQLPNLDGTSKDFDGGPLANPRMKAWNVYWNTTTHPDTERVLHQEAKKFLDLGADSMQVDDPLLQLYAAYLWGGDFNKSTLDGFKGWLKKYRDQGELRRLGLANLSGDYRDYLKRVHKVVNAQDYVKRFKSFPSTPIWLKYIQHTVAVHFAELRKFLDATRGQHVPLSMNLGLLNRPDEKNWHFFLAEYADYAIAETSVRNSDDMLMQAATMRALGTGLVPSVKAKDVADGRVAIASFYALGTQPMVPWDVFLGNDESGKSTRVYGTVPEYGDLYAFVRGNAVLFDQMEPAAVVGIPVPVDRYNDKATSALTDKLAQRRIPYAFVLTGGSERKFTVDAQRVHHFKLLVTANPDSDFSPSDLAALRASAVQRVSAGQLTDAMLQDLTPFIAVGDAAALKLYPRARPGSQIKQLMVHVVDESRGAPGSSDAKCKRRIGIRNALLGGNDVKEVFWHEGERRVPLELTKSERDVFFTVPDCTLWGVLLVQLSN